MRFNVLGALLTTIILLLTLLVGSSVTYTTSPKGYGYVELKVKWMVHSDPSPSADYANAVCGKDEYIYVIGVDTSVDVGQFRVEKRLKSSGELVKVWVFNPSGSRDELHDCIIVGNTLYAVGRSGASGIFAWAIVTLDLELNMLNYTVEDISVSRDVAESLTSDGEYLYITGSDSLPGVGDTQWRVEKRRLDDLTLVKSYTSNPTRYQDEALSISVNPVTGELWVFGWENVGGWSFWRIEILSRDLELIRVVKPGIQGFGYSIEFDEDGNAYIDGPVIAKFDKHGNIVKTASITADLLLYSGYFLYAFDLKEVDGVFRHFVHVLDRDLNVIHRMVLDANMSVPASIYARYNAVFDPGNIFVAGSHGGRGDKMWTVYSISVLERIVEVITQTVTETLVGTTTTTIEVVETRTITETFTITEVRSETVTLPPATYTITETLTLREPVGGSVFRVWYLVVAVILFILGVSVGWWLRRAVKS